MYSGLAFRLPVRTWPILSTGLQIQSTFKTVVPWVTVIIYLDGFAPSCVVKLIHDCVDYHNVCNKYISKGMFDAENGARPIPIQQPCELYTGWQT